MESQNPYSELYKIIKTESSAIQVDNCLVNADIRDLEAGQRVLVLPSADRQQFIVVCRLGV